MCGNRRWMFAIIDVCDNKGVPHRGAARNMPAGPRRSRPNHDMLRLTVPVGLKRVGREMRMLVENADDQTPADPSLLRIIARAHHIQARLIQTPS